MKKTNLVASLLLISSFAEAQTTDVEKLAYSGPFPVQAPVMIDTKDVNSKSFKDSNFLDTPIDFSILHQGKEINVGAMPGDHTHKALHIVGFTISNSCYTSADIDVNGIKHYNIYVDGKTVNGGHVDLQPDLHEVVIKYMSEPEKTDTAKISVDGKNITIGNQISETKHPFNLHDALDTKTYSKVSISPNGKHLIYNISETVDGGNNTQHVYLRNLQSNSVVEMRHHLFWMPKTNLCYYVRKNSGQSTYSIITIDPETLKEDVLYKNIPDQNFTMSPTEDYIIYSVSKEGPKERKDVYEVIDPDDRQPNWRTRSNLYICHFKNGVSHQLTYGHHDVWLNDISQDGRSLLIQSSERRLGARPTTLMSLYMLDTQDMTLDTLIEKDGFISSAQFSPDGKHILLTGSPDALNGIGRDISDNRIANMYDIQLFLSPEISKQTDYSPEKWTPLTKHFNPSIKQVTWTKADGDIYILAEDKDYQSVYRLNTKTLRFSKIETGEELVEKISLSSMSPTMAYYGEGASNGDRLHVINIKNDKERTIDVADEEHMSKIKIGECKAWSYITDNHDTICCRYYLPYDFDPKKEYPMIVNYYGGCSPTSRNFTSRYPQHAYSSLGYVVLVVNPRGATGFGQEWSAAHVNTAGQGIADDIIGAVKSFCDAHGFVKRDKIGCIGASYGGFMTQYLQTVTDIFAAAVSHAGISDHTSYWGEGYWGYSYSEVSMANSYPWTRKDLFVDQSPLYNADKIHTPLLLVHGTDDTNVPVGESIQMYNALKLLERPTALVLVKGENHWIMDYYKRIQWQNSIWAWFAKYLQDNSTWWDSMYGEKSL